MAPLEEDGDRHRRIRRAVGLAAAAGAGGYVAARVRGAKKRLTEARPPYVWKPGRGKSVLLKDIDVLDVKRGQVLRNRGVLFGDGQITEVVPTRDLEKVEADRTFDCSGLLVMPGLINAHCHCLMPCASVASLDFLLSVKRQAFRNLEECAIHGVTTLRDASGLPVVLNDISHRIETFDLLGPRIISCGPSINASGGYPDNLNSLPPGLASRYGNPIIRVDDPDSARQAVRTAVEQGARYIKTFLDDRSLYFGRKPLNTLDDKTVRAMVDEAHSLGRRVAAHQTQLAGFRRAVKLGVDDLEHAPTDAALAEKDVEDFMKGNHHLTPTATVSLALSIVPPGHPARTNPMVEVMQLERDEIMRTICPTVCEEAIARSLNRMIELYMEGDPSRKVTTRFSFDNELFLEMIIHSTPNITRLYEAGATICCGNDGGMPLSFPGVLTTEMQILKWLGLDNKDIIRSATINAAELSDLKGEVGSVEKGKLADLLLLSGNPLNDIGAVGRVEGVFRSGVLIHRGHSLPLESVRYE